MKAKISLITLGVSSLQASLVFYRDGLGLAAPDYQEGADVVFFPLEGTWLALYPRAALAEDATVPVAGAGFAGFTLAHNVASAEAVDAVVEMAVAAGARLVKEPQPTAWGGYSGYFADPDGFLWEVAHNPFMDLT